MITCHAQRCPIMYTLQRKWWHSTPNVGPSCVHSKANDGIATTHIVRSCVLWKGNDGMPRATSSVRVYILKAMMECHVDVVRSCVLSKGDDSITTTNVRTCVQSKGYDMMPCLMSWDSLHFPWVMMAFHDWYCPTLCMLSNGDNGQPHPTVCSSQGPWWYATPAVVRPCMMSKGDNCMPHLTWFHRLCCPRAMIACHTWRFRLWVLPKGYANMPRPMSTDLVCFPRAMITWHATLDFIWLCVQSKGDDGMPHPTLSHRVFYPRAKMACDAWGRPTACAAQCRWWYAMLDIVRPCVHN